MSAGMAGVIAAHGYSHAEIEDHSEYGFTDVAVCICGTRLYLGMTGEPNERDDLHAAHVAEELTKAGYGLVDPLAAALADPEGHALVKAIRERKADA